MTQSQSQLGLSASSDGVADLSAQTPSETPEKAPRLSVQLSKKLLDRLTLMSKDEGIGVEALVQELLAEAVTLRAWEIIERKSAMRGDGGNGNRGYGGNPQRGGHGGQGGHGGHGKSGGQRGPMHGQGGSRPRPSYSGQGGNAWMEDKAAFLEYVRNQERRGR